MKKILFSHLIGVAVLLSVYPSDSVLAQQQLGKGLGRAIPATTGKQRSGVTLSPTSSPSQNGRKKESASVHLSNGAQENQIAGRTKESELGKIGLQRNRFNNDRTGFDPDQNQRIGRGQLGGQGKIELRPDVETEDFGFERRGNRQIGKQPSEIGDLRRSGMIENDSVEAGLNNIRNQVGSNRNRGSSASNMRDGIVTDPSSLLKGASSGLAGDEANNVSMERSRGTDGSGNTQDLTIFKDRNGDIVQTESVTRDPNGVIIVNESQMRGPDGVLIERAVRNADGQYTHTSSIQRNDGTTQLGPIWRSDSPFFDVDPDSNHGRGSGEVVRPGHKAKDPKMVEARDRGIGPGARSDDSRAAGIQPRVNIDRFGTISNPGPVEQANGKSTYQGYNPNDYVRPPQDRDEK